MRDLSQSPTLKLPEQLSQRIGERIVGGEYAPSQFLPNESWLPVGSGVGRTIISEAVRILVSKGMREVRLRTGTHMLKASQWPLTGSRRSALAQSIKVDGSRLAHAMNLHHLVDPDEARYAASRRKEADIASIHDAVRRMRITYDNDGEYVVAETRDGYCSIARLIHSSCIAALATQRLSCGNPRQALTRKGPKSAMFHNTTAEP